ncbi:MAG: hypothetical protein ACRC0F_04105 [Cetobacterium sp.]
MSVEITKHFLNKVIVTIPVEITEVDNKTNLCSVKPLIYNELELPIIVKCPFMPIGSKTSNIKFKVQVGQRYMALFSQLDLSNYLTTGQGGQVTSKKEFSFTNCVILPILALTEVDNIQVPEMDFEINGNIKINGNIEINGGIKSTDDIIAGSISLQKHVHNYNGGDKPPAPTEKPQ